MQRTKIIVMMLLLGAGGCAASVQNDGLPEAAGVRVIRAQCLICHESDLISSQRLSKAGWTRELDKMIRWGAVIREADRELVINYLATYFPSKPFSKAAAVVQTSPSPNASIIERGRNVFEDKCLNCHGADMTEKQRLSRIGWTREVEKMTRWGATVTEAEKEPLVDFLAAKYPVRSR